MTQPETEDEKNTADIYHFRSRKDLWLYCALIVLLIAAIVWYLTTHGAVNA